VCVCVRVCVCVCVRVCVCVCVCVLNGWIRALECPPVKMYSYLKANKDPKIVLLFASMFSAF